VCAIDSMKGEDICVGCKYSVFCPVVGGISVYSGHCRQSDETLKTLK